MQKNTKIITSTFSAILLIFFLLFFTFLSRCSSVNNSSTLDKEADTWIKNIADITIASGGMVKPSGCRKLVKHGLIVVCEVDHVMLPAVMKEFILLGWQKKRTWIGTFDGHEINEFIKSEQCAAVEGRHPGEVFAITFGCYGMKSD